MITDLIWFPLVVLLFQIVPFFTDDFTLPIALIVGSIVCGFGHVVTLIDGATRPERKFKTVK